MTVWYKSNPNRHTYGELWRLSGRGLWPFAKAMWRKWFDIQVPPTSAFAFSDAPQIIALDSLPERPQEALRRMIAFVERHGFRFVFCHQGLHLGDFEEYTAVLLSADGLSLANAVWLKIGAEEGTNLVLGSRTQTRRLLTDGHPRGHDAPPEFDVWHRRGNSIRIGELIAQHYRRLDRVGREQIVRATENDIAARIIENQDRARAFDLGRGVLVPLTQVEVERLSGPVMAEVVAESANPFRAPCEDVSASPTSIIPTTFPGTWHGSVIAGFVVGTVFMEIIGLASYDRQELEDMRKFDGDWLYLLMLFVVWPFLIGAFCAGIGLAVWIIRRVFWRWIP